MIATFITEEKGNDFQPLMIYEHQCSLANSQVFEYENKVGQTKKHVLFSYLQTFGILKRQGRKKKLHPSFVLEKKVIQGKVCSWLNQTSCDLIPLLGAAHGDKSLDVVQNSNLFGTQVLYCIHFKTCQSIKYFGVKIN